MLRVLSLREARNLLLILCSVSKLPMWVLLIRCVVFFADVVHGSCVVSSSSVSCLIVDGAEFCVGASVHCVSVCASLLMFFQLAGSSGGG